MKLGRDEVLIARTYVKAFYQIRPGVDPRQDKKESKRASKTKGLECCHSGSSFGQIFQGMIPGRGKKGRVRASHLMNPPSDQMFTATH